MDRVSRPIDFAVSARSRGSRFDDWNRLGVDLVSDMSREAIREFGLEIDIPELGLHGIANRAVFVFDGDGTVTYRWVADDPTNEPTYDELLTEVKEA